MCQNVREKGVEELRREIEGLRGELEARRGRDGREEKVRGWLGELVAVVEARVGVQDGVQDGAVDELRYR